MDPMAEKFFVGLLPFLNPNLTDEQIALVVEKIEAFLDEVIEEAGGSPADPRDTYQP